MVSIVRRSSYKPEPGGAEFLSQAGALKDRPEQAGKTGLEVVAAEGVEARRAFVSLLDQPGLSEHLEVVGAGGLGHRDLEAATVELALGDCKRSDNLEAHRVAEGVQHGAELDLGSQWTSDLLGGLTGHSHASLYDGRRTRRRRWFDVATRLYRGTAGIYGGAWTGPVFVLTHRPPAPSEDSTVTFLSDGIEEAVATAGAAAGNKNLEIFGADTARQCLQEGLIDEIVIHLAPVLLGDGVRLYGGHDVESVGLERTALAEAGQLTDLRFRVEKQPGAG